MALDKLDKIDKKERKKNGAPTLGKFMQRALLLAERGRGSTSPNPMVGAVIVKGGKIIAEGFHAKAGGPHAEIVALKKAAKKARGAHLILNLEPCCHHGRTPPCTESIIAAGIKRVSYAMRDPNPLVHGNGAKLLKKAGIVVDEGVLKEDAERLNEVFCKSISTGLPWVTLKAAMTLDGYIGAAEGEERQLSGEAAQQLAHQLRAEHDAILIGIGTLLRDNPQLNIRHGIKANKLPLKVILDSQLRTPIHSRVFDDGKTLIFTATSSLQKRAGIIREFHERGAEIVALPQQTAGGAQGILPAQMILQELARRQITSLLLEGGAQVFTAFMRAKAVDKLQLFLTPKIIGSGSSANDSNNIRIFNSLDINRLDQALSLKDLSVIRAGADLLITAYPA